MKIRVNEDYSIAGGTRYSGRQSCLLAEIAGKRDDPDPLIIALQFSENVQRGIAASVIYVEDLKIGFWNFIEGGKKAVMHLADDHLLVVARYDDRQEREAAHIVGGRGHKHWLDSGS